MSLRCFTNQGALLLSCIKIKSKALELQNLLITTSKDHLSSFKQPHVIDQFFQPIDRAAVLKQFPNYTMIGRMKGEYEANAPDRFAIIELGAHQFKVVNKDLIYTEQLRDLNVMDIVKFRRVLLWATAQNTIIGRPYIEGAQVIGVVEEQCRDAKDIIFKKKRRKNYRRTKGHRQELTGIRIIEICDLEDMVNYQNYTDILNKASNDTMSDTY